MVSSHPGMGWTPGGGLTGSSSRRGSLEKALNAVTSSIRRVSRSSISAAPDPSTVRNSFSLPSPRELSQVVPDDPGQEKSKESVFSVE